MKRGMLEKRQEAFVLAGEFAPIVQSAFRLYDDAKVLRASRAYPSAAALAVLSIEEVGKFMLHHEAFQDNHALSTGASTQSLRSHRKKQEMTASLLIGNLLLSETEHLLGLTVITRASDVFSGRIEWEKLTKAIGSIDKRALMKDRLKNYKHHGFLIDLAAGRFDVLKQSCFYSDIDSRGQWAEAGFKIDRTTSDKVIKLSHVALNKVYKAMKSHEWQKANW